MQFLSGEIWKIVLVKESGLYFSHAIEDQDNGSILLEIVHSRNYLTKVFCRGESDIFFNFQRRLFILDEFLLEGEVQETSVVVLKAI